MQPTFSIESIFLPRGRLASSTQPRTMRAAIGSKDQDSGNLGDAITASSRKAKESPIVLASFASFCNSGPVDADAIDQDYALGIVWAALRQTVLVVV